MSYYFIALVVFVVFVAIWFAILMVLTVDRCEITVSVDRDGHVETVGRYRP